MEYSREEAAKPLFPILITTVIGGDRVHDIQRRILGSNLPMLTYHPRNNITLFGLFEIKKKEEIELGVPQRPGKVTP